MCGFVAAIAKRDELCKCDWPARCAPWHRGPDATGALRALAGGFSVALGMSRLKIVDQQDLPVPFKYSHLGVLLAFNGEIYNWKALRDQYDWLGPWQSNCDAEVLAAAWRAKGPECLHELNGMFSFILVDLWEEEIFLARDRFGQKPLFYAERQGRLYVSSEVKALPIQLEEVECLDAETLEYDVLSDTPLRGVKRLEPGCYIHLTDGHVVPRPVRWYSLPAVVNEPDPATSLDELEALVLDSVALRCRSEVPVTLQFSGGLDSTLIYYACRRQGIHPALHCVTMDEIDHLSVAKLAAPEAQVETTLVTRESFFHALSLVAYHLDTPATWTAVCQWLMNESISRSGGRIVISGEGADEVFGGYSRYRVAAGYGVEDPHLVGYEPLLSVVNAAEEPLVALLDRGGTPATRARATEWIKRYGHGREGWRALAATELWTTMQVLLRMADRMASAWSLENRCPLLDYRIVELGWQMPNSWLITGQESKSILRMLGRRWGLPAAIVNERVKRGLAVPWALWAPGGGLPGARGAWDRRGFAALMRRAWRRTLLQEHRGCHKIA